MHCRGIERTRDNLPLARHAAYEYGGATGSNSHKSKLAGLNWEDDSIINATSLYFTVKSQLSVREMQICNVPHKK